MAIILLHLPHALFIVTLNFEAFSSNVFNSMKML